MQQDITIQPVVDILLDVNGDINFTGDLKQNGSTFSAGGGAFELDTGG